MPRIMVTMKLTEEERALLRERSDKQDMTEADYLRMCMMMEAITAGNFKALKIFGDKVRGKLAAVGAVL